MLKKPKVLFLCTGNSARSQMAEAFLRTYAGEHFEAHSAGLRPKGINPYTRQVMDEVGIDIRQQRSKSLREYLARVKLQYLVTVCAQAEENCPRTFLGVNNHLHWAFEDPVAFEGSEEEKLQRFRQIRDQIDARLKAWLAELDLEVGSSQQATS